MATISCGNAPPLWSATGWTEFLRQIPARAFGTSRSLCAFSERRGCSGASCRVSPSCLAAEQALRRCRYRYCCFLCRFPAVEKGRGSLPGSTN